MANQGDPIYRALDELEHQQRWRRYLSRRRSHEGAKLGSGGGILWVVADTIASMIYLALMLATSAAFCFALWSATRAGILESLLLFGGAMILLALIVSPILLRWVVPANAKSPRTVWIAVLVLGALAVTAWWIPVGTAVAN